MHPSRLDLIVAAPQDYARMIPQSSHLIDSFPAHILLKGRIPGYHIAAEHELLPDHDAELIADVIEIVGLVICASPCPHHIHMGFPRSLQDLPVPFRRDTIGEAVKRNHVCAFCKDRNSVYEEGKALAPFVGYAPQLK